VVRKYTIGSNGTMVPYFNDADYPLSIHSERADAYASWGEDFGIYIYLQVTSFWKYIGAQFIWPLSGGDYNFGMDDVDVGEERPTAGSTFMFVFGFAVDLLMLNMLIAMMSSTYEAAMEVASLNFKVYKAKRVMTYRQAPRLPPYLYCFTLIGGSLGWIVRRVGVIDRTRYPLRAFWDQRPSFFFDDPKTKWRPREEDIRAADKAMATAFSELKGAGYEVSVKAAKMKNKRSSQGRDGVATRESVNYIVRANVGEAQEETNARLSRIEEEMNARSSEMNARSSETNSRLSRIENHLDALVRALPRESEMVL